MEHQQSQATGILKLSKAWHLELPMDGMHDEFLLLFNTPPNNHLGFQHYKEIIFQVKKKKNTTLLLKSCF